MNPHDPEILPNGKILVASSSIHETTEVTRDGEVVWRFRSPGIVGIRGNHRLPNGNTLFAYIWGILEVGPSGNIVWQLELLNLETNEKCLYKAERISR